MGSFCPSVLSGPSSLQSSQSSMSGSSDLSSRSLKLFLLFSKGFGYHSFQLQLSPCVLHLEHFGPQEAPKIWLKLHKFYAFNNIAERISKEIIVISRNCN